MTSTNLQTSRPPDHPLLNLFINILLPVVILNKGTPHLGAKTALILALSLPLIYGIVDFLKNHHKNYVSLFGLFNIALTGGLALMNLNGIWFCVKEALLPFSLGVLVLASAWSKTPAAQIMFCNPHVLNMSEIDQALIAKNRLEDFKKLLGITTIWLSISFFISAILNFGLALKIFTNIDPNLEATQQAVVLNEQIAKMTWAGLLVIALPLMVLSGILIFWFLKKIAKMTDLHFDKLLKS